MLNKALSLPLLCLALCATATLAQERTPLGAIAAGNADGSIPAWTGGLAKTALTEGYLQNPYAEDQPLFTVSADNLQEHSEHLTAGQQALLEKYPESYRLPVYPSRRSASYPDYVYQALDTNRSSATLVDNGKRQGVQNARITSPFPEPENGLEAIWNHIMRWRGILVERQTSWVPVTASGRYRPIILHEEIAFPYASPQFVDASEDTSNSVPEYQRAMVVTKQKFLSPGRLSGNGSLVFDTFDYTRHERVRWLYPVELKRVVRMPRQELDQPLLSSEGIIRLDDTDMFRGSTENFEWELAGPMEKLVPYNAYGLVDRQLKFADLIGRFHLKPKHTRYELHRVWEVTATAKTERRGGYSKRVFYLDEDSWQIVLSEKYDAEGELSNVAEAHTLNYYSVPVVYPTLQAHYSLDDGRFMIQGINNMLPPPVWSKQINPRNFSPNALLDYLR